MPSKKQNNNNNNNKQPQKQPPKQLREPQGETPAKSFFKARGSLGRTTEVEPNIPKGMLNFVN